MRARGPRSQGVRIYNHAQQPRALHPKRDDRARDANDLGEATGLDFLEDRARDAVCTAAEIMKRDYAAVFHEWHPSLDVGLARLVRMIAVDEDEVDRAAFFRKRFRSSERIADHR